MAFDANFEKAQLQGANFMSADFPEPPGPVINILFPIIYLLKASRCSFDNSILLVK